MRKFISIVLAGAVLYGADGWTGSFGISYSKGKYGTDYETTTTSFYLSATYKFYPFSLSFSIPYIKTQTVYRYTTQINNNNDTTSDTERDSSYGGYGNSGYGSSGGSYYRVLLKAYDSYYSGSSSSGDTTSSSSSTTSDSNSDTTEETNVTKTEVNEVSGKGDLRIKLSASTILGRGVYLSNTIGIKLPTADDGLGTGQVDYMLEAKIYQVKSYRDMLFYALGYTITGDATNKEYPDYLYGNVGIIRTFRFFKGGAKLSYTQATREGGDDAVSFSLFAMINRKQKENYFYSMGFGLTDGAPKFSFSVFVSYKLD